MARSVVSGVGLPLVYPVRPQTARASAQPPANRWPVAATLQFQRTGASGRRRYHHATTFSHCRTSASFSGYHGGGNGVSVWPRYQGDVTSCDALPGYGRAVDCCPHAPTPACASGAAQLPMYCHEDGTATKQVPERTGQCSVAMIMLPCQARATIATFEES